MTLDISRMTDQELRRLIAAWCSEFGSVKNVKIFRVRETRICDFAAIEMSARNEALEVARKLGDSDFGSVVIMKLRQEQKSLPAFLRRQ
jgi:hypothetical protein